MLQTTVLWTWISPSYIAEHGSDMLVAYDNSDAAQCTETPDARLAFPKTRMGSAPGDEYIIDPCAQDDPLHSRATYQINGICSAPHLTCEGDQMRDYLCNTIGTFGSFHLLQSQGYFNGTNTQRVYVSYRW